MSDRAESVRAQYDAWFRKHVPVPDYYDLTMFRDNPDSNYNKWLVGWLARSAIPIMVSEEMVEAGARAAWLHEMAPCSERAWDVYKGEFPSACDRYRKTMRLCLTAALTVSSGREW